MDRLIYKEADGDLTCRSRDFDKVFPTLYAYEESGLTPDQAKALKDNLDAMTDMARDLSEKLEQAKAEAADLRKNIDHVRELLKAEQEGRLHIQPNLCKPGDTLYIIGYLDSLADAEILGPYPIIAATNTITYDRMNVNTKMPLIRFGEVDYSDIGKSVFLTREEAEDALVKLKED